jgi:hypothetical protein
MVCQCGGTGKGIKSKVGGELDLSLQALFTYLCDLYAFECAISPLIFNTFLVPTPLPINPPCFVAKLKILFPNHLPILSMPNIWHLFFPNLILTNLFPLLLFHMITSVVPKFPSSILP